jgi:hypothetical protein
VRRIGAISLLLVMCIAPAFADDAKPAAAQQTKPAQTTTDASKTQPAQTAPTASEQAVSSIPQPIEPPGSSDDLNDELANARPRRAGILKNGPVSLFDPYWDAMNDKLEKQFGLKFGMAYTYVLQSASDSDTDHKTGMAGDFDIFARAHFFGPEDAPCRGVFGIYGEYRHDFSQFIPKDIGPNFDSLWRTVNGFGRQDMALTQCWWEQHMLDDKFVVTAGKIDPDNYYNKNRYQSDSTAFMSQAFSTNPARKHPSNGLGVNLLGKVAKEWYVTTGVNDANGDKQKSGFHTIDEGELFAAAEVGWTPTFEGEGKGAYRLTYWDIEDATHAHTNDDRGVALSCEQELCSKYVPFFRAAVSDGEATNVRAFACGGVGLEGLLVGKKDLTGIGVAWGDPKSRGRDQFGGEFFHRFQLAPDVQLTVGYQYYVDPSFAPSSSHDPVGVFEIRVRIEF